MIPFGDCSLSVVGTYVLKASDSNSGVTPDGPRRGQSGPRRQAGLHDVSPNRHGVEDRQLGLITVQEQDAFGNPVNGAATVNLASTSSGAILAQFGGHHSYHVCVHPGRVFNRVLLLR